VNAQADALVKRRNATLWAQLRPDTQVELAPLGNWLLRWICASSPHAMPEISAGGGIKVALRGG